jgi:hypothetical protein
VFDPNSPSHSSCLFIAHYTPYDFVGSALDFCVPCSRDEEHDRALSLELQTDIFLVPVAQCITAIVSRSLSVDTWMKMDRRADVFWALDTCAVGGI